MNRTAFIISDSTGLTAETLGNALLSQFDIPFNKIFCPYVDTIEKAKEIALRIEAAAKNDGVRPLIFETLVNKDVRAVITASSGYVLDIYGTFLNQLETELREPSIPRVGKTHYAPTQERSLQRMNAVDYALNYDDGAKMDGYDVADIVLVGVSRSAKTPTSLYIAMQFSLFSANYPLTEEDLDKGDLPKELIEQKRKLFALTIEPARLSQIRTQRRADSRYASIQQCSWEVREAMAIYRRYGIPHIDTTYLSVEEIATQIIFQTGIERKR